MSTLYVSDLDGTLLDKNARLTERSCEIIRGLIEKGMMFTVATARSLSSLEILKPLGIRLPCIQLNGVLIYDFLSKDYIGCTEIIREDAEAVIELLRKHDRMSFVYKADSQYGIHVQFERLSNEVERNFFEARKDNDYKSFAQVERIGIGESDRVIYFTMVDSYDRLRPIYDEMLSITGVRPTLYSDNYSELYFLEVFSSRATKASGLHKLRELTGADRIVAFGDNLNDLEMLRTADVGIAVADAVREVRDAADIVIGSSYEDGVANYLQSVFAEQTRK